MSERNEPVDPRHEEALAAALHAEADAVRTYGDGLTRIRARVERRRMRMRLLVPIAGTAAVAATVTAVVGIGLLTSSHTNKPSISALDTTTLTAATSTAAKPTPTVAPTTPTSSTQPSALATTAAVVTTDSAVVTSSSPSVTTIVAATTPPGPTPIWPFADKAAAETWQKTAATDTAGAWHLDARATAVRFVTALKLPPTAVSGGAPRIDPDGTAAVDLTRVETGSAKSTVLGTVRLARWSTGADAPWGVVDVTSPAGAQFPLAITSPTSKATVGAPLPVSFTLVGGEDDVYVSAWAAGAAKPAATKQTVTSTGMTVTLDSAVPTAGTGFVVVADGSSGAGSFKLSRLAVSPVTFGVGAPAAAATYVAVVAGRIHVYDAATNAEVHPLAGDATGVTQVAVSDDRQWVYYLQGATNGCGSGSLMRTPLDGTGSPEKVDTGVGPVTLFGIAGAHAEQLVYATTPCATDQILHWRNADGTTGQVTGFPKPPLAESLAISTDGTALAANIKTGLQSGLETFALPTAHKLADGGAPAGCATPESSCVTATYAANGDLLYVKSDGQRLTVFRTHTGTSTELFHVAAAFGQPNLDLDQTGTKVLLADGLGHAWSWAGSGAAKALPGTITDASW